LAAVKRITVQVARQPLQHELHALGHDLLRKVYADRGLIYNAHIGVVIHKEPDSAQLTTVNV
jgi:hypothetical protein